MMANKIAKKQKHGIQLIVQKRDGQEIRGELIAVNHNSLLLLEFESAVEVSIKITDIKVIKVIKKSLLAILVGILGLLEGDWFFEDSGAIPKRCVTIQIEGKTHEEIEKAIKKLQSKIRVKNNRRYFHERN
jgi:hypothetical protein